MVLTCGCQTIGLSYPILLPLPRGYAIAPKTELRRYGDSMPAKKCLKLAVVFNSDSRVRKITHYSEVG